jgi:hypothetical protein
MTMGSRGRKLMIGVLVLLNLSATVFSVPTNKRESNQKLRFKQDGAFQIAVFNDLHYGEGREVL